MKHYYSWIFAPNWEITFEWYLTEWALPLSIDAWYTRNNHPEVKEYDWYNKPDGHITIHILFLTIRLNYDALGVE